MYVYMYVYLNAIYLTSHVPSPCHGTTPCRHVTSPRHAATSRRHAVIAMSSLRRDRRQLGDRRHIVVVAISSWSLPLPSSSPHPSFTCVSKTVKTTTPTITTALTTTTTYEDDYENYDDCDDYDDFEFVVINSDFRFDRFDDDFTSTTSTTRRQVGGFFC